MSEIIYKPYSIISKEWNALCNQYHDTLDRLYKIKSAGKYPSEQWWNETESAQIEYKKIRDEMDHYRETVKISD